MKLLKYMEECGFTVPTLANYLGVDRSLVHRWLHDGLLPSERHVILIYEKSGGRVRPDDLYSLPPLRPRRREAPADALP
jgi:hypothetical protein